MKCPTCGPTTTERHPRRDSVTRCANCKEWLSAEQTPDIERVLAEHVQIRDVSGVVLCMCGEWIAYMAGGSPGDDDRHRAHVAQALAPVLAAAVRDALREAAMTLPALTEGPQRAGTARWPECDRDAYSLAIEEAQAALRDRADRVAEPQHEAATSSKESEAKR